MLAALTTRFLQRRLFSSYKGKPSFSASSSRPVSKFKRLPPSVPSSIFGKSSFGKLGVSKPVTSALGEFGIYQPTIIQELVFQPLREGRHAIISSQTGSGKSLAFALPLAMRLKEWEGEGVKPKPRSPNIIVITPSRELCSQTVSTFKPLCHSLKLSCDLATQQSKPATVLKRLQVGVNILVCTPGRLASLLHHGSINCRMLQTLVLDEVDELLKDGTFVYDVLLKRLFPASNTKLQVCAVGASVDGTTKAFMQKEVLGRFGGSLWTENKGKAPSGTGTSTTGTTLSRGVHISWVSVSSDKMDALVQLLEEEPSPVLVTLVFVNTKRAALAVTRSLQEANISSVVAQLDSSISVQERKSLWGELAGVGNRESRRIAAEEHDEPNRELSTAKVIVCTDAAARGLHIPTCNHVILFDMPTTATDLLHRIGRTARLGKKGKVSVLLKGTKDRRLQDSYRDLLAQVLQQSHSRIL